MNKSVKKLLAVLLMVLVVSQLGMLTAFADYGYTIRIYAGNDATFSGNTDATLKNGNTVAVFDASTYSPMAVQNLLNGLNYNEKYYVMGIRQSGRDNNTVSSIPTAMGKEDVDYVVAYGIRGKLVEYTIHYVDEAGNRIADSQTYVGNVGDEPVVSFLYIDGYEPLAYNITKTLVDGNNEWNFPYRQIVTATPEPSATPAPAEGAEGAEGEGAAEGAEGAEGEEAGAEGDTTIDEEGAPLDEGPQEILDLDEEDTPLAQQPTERQQEQANNRTKLFASVGILAAALAAIAAFIIIFLKKRKEEKDAQ